MFIFLIIGLLLGALVVMFALQNLATVAVTFLVWEINGSLALILVIAVFIGMIISWLLGLSQSFKKSAQISKLSEENKELRRELSIREKEVQEEQNKLAATNAYVDDLEKTTV